MKKTFVETSEFTSADDKKLYRQLVEFLKDQSRRTG